MSDDQADLLTQAAYDLLSDASEWSNVQDQLHSIGASLRGTVVFLGENTHQAKEITGTIRLLNWIIEHAQRRETAIRAIAERLTLAAVTAPVESPEPEQQADAPIIH